MEERNIIVVLNDGETHSDLGGCEIIELTPEVVGDSVRELCGEDEENIVRIWHAHEIVEMLYKAHQPTLELEPTFWADALRDTTPRAGDVLGNHAMVLLAKPLPKQDGLCHGSIVLCLRDRNISAEFVTWHYNEDNDGCDHGRYFGTDLRAAFADWVGRV